MDELRGHRLMSLTDSRASSEFCTEFSPETWTAFAIEA